MTTIGYNLSLMSRCDGGRTTTSRGRGNLTTGKKIAFTIAVSVIALTAGAVALSRFGGNMTPASLLARSGMRSNPTPGFEGHPFAGYVASDKVPQHTSDGFRLPTQLTGRGRLVVCMGGSSTYGTAVPGEDAYPAQLNRLLGDDYNVVNAGVPGYTTANIIGLLASRIVHLKPDTAIFYVGFNDAWNRIDYGHGRVDYTHAQKLWDENCGVHLNDKVRPLRNGDRRDNAKWGADVFRRNLETICGICAAHDIRVVFVLQATDYEHHPDQYDTELWLSVMAEHAAITIDVAESTGAVIVDCRSMSNQADYFADDLHMTATGNAERARRIALFAF